MKSAFGVGACLLIASFQTACFSVPAAPRLGDNVASTAIACNDGLLDTAFGITSQSTFVSNNILDNLTGRTELTAGGIAFQHLTNSQRN